MNQTATNLHKVLLEERIEAKLDELMSLNSDMQEQLEGIRDAYVAYAQALEELLDER